MKKKIPVLLIIACLAFSSLGYGEVIQGEIADLAADGFFLKIDAKAGREKAKTELKQILVSPETEFEGSSMTDLRAGDEVLVEVSKTRGKILAAQKVTLDKVDIRNS